MGKLSETVSLGPEEQFSRATEAQIELDRAKAKLCHNLAGAVVWLTISALLVTSVLLLFWISAGWGR